MDEVLSLDDKKVEIFIQSYVTGILSVNIWRGNALLIRSYESVHQTSYKIVLSDVSTIQYVYYYIIILYVTIITVHVRLCSLYMYMYVQYI